MASSEYVWHIFKTTTIIISLKRGGFPRDGLQDVIFGLLFAF